MAQPRAVPLLLLLLLLTSVVAVQYQWLDTVSLPDPAVRSIPAPSDLVCAIRCEALGFEQCSGFHYESSDGMCHLFSADCRGPAADSSQLTTVRYMARNTCPGTVSDPCACPSGFHRCAGRCLARLDTAVIYTEAESQCAALGAHLAVPRSDEENQCAFDAADGVAVWLGLNDVDTEGQFVAIDGCGTMTSDGPYWADGQPDNQFPGQDFAQLRYYIDGNWNPGWNDFHQDGLYRPLCQLAHCHQHGCQ